MKDSTTKKLPNLKKLYAVRMGILSTKNLIISMKTQRPTTVVMSTLYLALPTTKKQQMMAIITARLLETQRPQRPKPPDQHIRDPPLVRALAAGMPARDYLFHPVFMSWTYHEADSVPYRVMLTTSSEIQKGARSYSFVMRGSGTPLSDGMRVLVFRRFALLLVHEARHSSSIANLIQGNLHYLIHTAAVVKPDAMDQVEVTATVLGGRHTATFSFLHLGNGSCPSTAQILGIRSNH